RTVFAGISSVVLDAGTAPKTAYPMQKSRDFQPFHPCPTCAGTLRPIATPSMTSPRIVVFDLDGTLVDTAPDLINALNFVLDREGLPPVPLAAARNMIGAGARKLIERGLEVEGHIVSIEELNRLMRDFIDYYAEHIADESRQFDGLEAALDELEGRGYRFA